LYTAHEKRCHSALLLSVTKQMCFECSSKLSECNVRLSQLGCQTSKYDGCCDHMCFCHLFKEHLLEATVPSTLLTWTACTNSSAYLLTYFLSIVCRWRRHGQ